MYAIRSYYVSNCVVCHEGNLGVTLTDGNFVVETCKSCHPVTGPAGGTNPKQAPALVKILPAIVPQHAPPFATACNLCHTTGPTGFAPLFNEIHTGYNKTIYADAAGTKS